MMRMLPILALPFLFGACAGSTPTPVISASQAVPMDAQLTTIFDDTLIQFLPSDSSLNAEPEYGIHGKTGYRDSGRIAWRTAFWIRGTGDMRFGLTAVVETRPIPKTALSVHDPWDRAGSVSLRRPGAPNIEVLKFMTAYGGVTRHSADVTWLVPFLVGDLGFEGFVDTWSSPGWRMDFSLELRPDTSAYPPDWGLALFNEQSVTRDLMDAGPIRVAVEIPADLERIEMLYFVSGHCTDGRGADEFESKPNVLTIDGEERIRFEPWRDDCLRFRPINPYCKKWSDGSWSSDFSRSGWCPGDAVAPHRFDLSGLAPGAHDFEFTIENIRPRDESGHGYWRVSAVLIGWEK